MVLQSFPPRLAPRAAQLVGTGTGAEVLEAVAASPLGSAFLGEDAGRGLSPFLRTGCGGTHLRQAWPLCVRRGYLIARTAALASSSLVPTERNLVSFLQWKEELLLLDVGV